MNRNLVNETQDLAISASAFVTLLIIISIILVFMLVNQRHKSARYEQYYSNALEFIRQGLPTEQEDSLLKEIRNKIEKGV